MHAKFAKIGAISITLLIASPALAYYGHYGHAYGHGYGHGYRYYGRSHGYPYYGYRRYGHGYGYGYRRYPYPHGLAYGLLSIPGRVVTGLPGGPYYGRSYSGKPYVPPVGRGIDSGEGTNADTATPRTDGRIDGDATNQSSHGTQAGPGWALLAHGYYARALSVFGRQAHSNPRAGAPKVGYALSTAAGGDLGRGVWAMRRAARIDPQSIHYVNVDPRLTAELDRLTVQYRANLDRGTRDHESAFMVASLQYLAGNMETARSALQKAVEYGDNRVSTQNLARLIEEGSASGASHSGTTPVPKSGSRASGDY